ncbi:protein-L-isoaspartate(D-aspartate)O-methyltransferase [Corynebacterium humireducens NBRC 106098 = DSM 45392]|uniref:Protein-L-isoaspartate O-methyltransferase n=1 Tax=Corynebacterium humireducens NBRC 106098 = DSM 45392 TaxID=1223515 RepID=A0A0B5D2A0_9CORY|nr:methyltransferase domain-containing protein [Corynebacterium humireducens]AJE32801.1 protein-L-isoaspartate(D-aspartate)O-methyltransferase [Corynebacterium humireducens NBRC 106098 = DSM 45392]
MDDRIREVMSRVDRADFLPLAARRHAPFDLPIAIGHGQTNSQPYTVAVMLRLLDVRPGHRVLDVGSGSGWTTALLHELLDGTGHLTAVEIVPELVEFGRSNLAAVGRDVTVHQATEGVFGLPDQGPFDRILVSAEADTLPQELIDQLRVGGVMVIPVAGTMLRVERINEDEAAVTEHGAFRFVPLLRWRGPVNSSGHHRE